MQAKLTKIETEMLNRVYDASQSFSVGGNWNLSELSLEIEQGFAHFRKLTKSEQRALDGLVKKGIITRATEGSFITYRYNFDPCTRAQLSLLAVQRAIEHQSYYSRFRNPQEMPETFPYDFNTYKTWARETSIDGEYLLQMLEQLAARVEIDAMKHGIAA